MHPQVRERAGLLLPMMEFLPPDDEHVKAATLDSADELTQGGLVLRYQVERQTRSHPSSRNEGVVMAHIYPCIGILTHGLPALRNSAVEYFPSFW
jgi:hypothetical protein